MKRRLVGHFLLIGFVAFLPGCLAAAAGAAVGAGVVYAVSEDTARVDLNGDAIRVTEEVERVLDARGEVTSSLRRAGTVEADVDGSKVTVRVFPVEEYVRVRVTARRVVGVFPNLELAREIANEVRRAFP
jgi:hypothetical protein